MSWKWTHGTSVLYVFLKNLSVYIHNHTHTQNVRLLIRPVIIIHINYLLWKQTKTCKSIITHPKCYIIDKTC